LNFLHQLFVGHPLLEKRPVTLAVTGDSVIPWKDQAHQFAVLKDNHFHAPGRPGSEVLKDPLWGDFIPADFALS